MSFDLALNKGKIVLDKTGEVRVVQNHSLLLQNCLKIIFTPKGSDPFFLDKGSGLSKDDIGKRINKQFLEQRSASIIETALNYLKNVQRQQIRYQSMTNSEILKEVSSIEVEIDELDPRQYNVNIAIKSGADEIYVVPEFTLDIVS